MQNNSFKLNVVQKTVMIFLILTQIAKMQKSTRAVIETCEEESDFENIDLSDIEE